LARMRGKRWTNFSAGAGRRRVKGVHVRELSQKASPGEEVPWR